MTTHYAPYRAFFARKPGSINGVFTIVDTKTGKKIFNRLPTRSGLISHVKTEWVRGASPIPKTKSLGNKPLLIHLVRPNQEGQWAGKSGIGEFWMVSNIPHNTKLIQGLFPDQQRLDIGLHPENSFDGSKGCIVFLNKNETQKKEIIRLSQFFKSLIGVYKFITLESIDLLS